MDSSWEWVVESAGNPYRRYDWLTSEMQRELFRRELLSLDPGWSYSTRNALLVLSAAPFDSQHLGVPTASLLVHCRELAAHDEFDSLAKLTDEAMCADRLALVNARVYEPDDQVRHLLRSLQFRPAGLLLHLFASTDGLRSASPGTPVIRDADAGDEPVFGSLAAAYMNNRLLGLPELNSQRVRQLYSAWAAEDLRGRMTLNLVATVEGRPAGFLAAGVRAPYGALSDIALIDLLVVDGACRRMGVGRALLVEAMRRLASEGIQRVEVGVNHANPVARALYSSLNFEQHGTSGDYLRWISG